jgi:cytochrome c2
VYFTDFFGPQSTGDAAGKGRVLRLSPSERTRSLPLDTRPEKWEKWDAARKGKYVFVRIAGCGACHAVERLTDGREGPALTELVPRLSARLGSDAYRRDVEALQAGAEPAAQARLAGVLEARGDDRLRHWLKSHIRDPRFDNPRGKMPAFGLLSAEELDSLVEFLLTLR